ncbi:PAS domain-containing protein [bacterium]|nr:PAS domain-containing protein [bacterium]
MSTSNKVTEIQIYKDWLQSIVNGLIDGVILINDNNEIVLINSLARKLLGLHHRAAVTMENLKRAKHIDITSLLEESIQKHYDVQNHIRKVDSLQKILGISVKRLLQQDGTHLGWMVILRDITTSWEMDRLRKEFIAKVSHELRSPITAIQEGVSLVLEEKIGNLNSSQRHCLKVTKESIERLERLVENLLKITRLEIPEDEIERRKTVRINQLIKSLVTTYQWIADKKQIIIKKNLPNHMINIQADRDKIAQILTNLLDNALKFTPEKGKIEIGLKEEAENVILWIKDSGIGIQLSEQEKIFAKFHRGDNSINHKIKGYGLGLFIAKEIVLYYRGRIWVESQPGKGSTFFVQLPRGH